MPPTPAIANDTLLVQLVRGALGRAAKTGGLSRPHVSSCKFVVTLHGTVESAADRARIGAVARAVPGVRGVVNKLRLEGGATVREVP